MDTAARGNTQRGREDATPEVRRLFAQGRLRDLIERKQFLKIGRFLEKEENLDQADIQSGYRHIIDHHDDYLHGFSDYEQATGIPIASDTVQQGYADLLSFRSQSDLAFFLRLYNQTNIKPALEAEQIENFYKGILGGRLDNLSSEYRQLLVLVRNLLAVPCKFTRASTQTFDQSHSANTPPYIAWLLQNSGLENHDFVQAVDAVFEESERKKRGRSERRSRFEFAWNVIFKKLLDVSDDRRYREFLFGRVREFGKYESEALHLTSFLQYAIRRDADMKTNTSIIDITASLLLIHDAIEDLILSGNKELAQQWENPFYKGDIKDMAAEDVLAFLRQERNALASVLTGFAPTQEQFERAEASWGDLRPLFILGANYRKGFPEGMALFTEMCTAIFEDRWDEFRYDHPEAQRLLEGMSDEAREVWRKKLPDRAIGRIHREARTSTQVMREARKYIQTGIEEGHLYSPDMPHTEWAHEIYRWFTSTESPTRDSVRAAQDVIDLVLYQRMELSKLLRLIGLPFDHSPNLVAIQSYIETKLTELAGLEKMKPAQYVQQQRAILNRGLWWVEQSVRYEGKKKEILARFGYGANLTTADLQGAKENLSIAKKIATLLTLSMKEVSHGYLADFEGVATETTITEFVERFSQELREKHSPLAHNVENVRVLLTTSTKPLDLVGLFLEETDSPKALLESGKYPVGATSCQTYEGAVAHTKCLQGLAVDADKKLLNIRKEDGTIVARALAKIVWIDGTTPSIFLEPTYTSVPGSDAEFDKIFNRWTCTKAAALGGVKVMRGRDWKEKGAIVVTVRASRNYYQYEDGGKGGAHHAGLGVKAGEYQMKAGGVGCA